MPLIENDVIFAFLNEYDSKHGIAERFFRKLEGGEINVNVSSVSLVEMELIYRSEGREDKLLRDLSAVAALPNVDFLVLTPDVAVASVYLRRTLKLSFFDSHYAAAALDSDRKIISFDQAYDSVPGLIRIEPENA